MTNNFDLNTQLSRFAAASITSNIGGAIPAGKTRFLTYIRVERLPAVDPGSPIESIDVAITSLTTGATTVADHSTIVAEAKLVLMMASMTTANTAIHVNDAMLKNEIRGSIEQPILSVAGGKHMVLSKASDVSASVFAQYYDA